MLVPSLFIKRFKEEEFMKKKGGITLMIMLSVALVGCGNSGNGSQISTEEQPKEEQQQTDENLIKTTVTNLVTNFGLNLQKVSLLAPEDIVKTSIKENYGDFISPNLFSTWQNDPQNAPGRLVSSPWPDRIEILSIEKLSEVAYKVEGEIIEITSDKTIAAKRPVTLLVKMINNRWLIDGVTIAAYEEADSIVYQNPQYGFQFSLPLGWEDYQIISEKWEGHAIGGSQGDTLVESGPMIVIRHPQWTSQNQRQDIPIMIFTIEQWNSLQKEEFHIGAAPIGPRELARNTSYVFALPARYNFAFPEGYEEVESILEGNALQPTKIEK
jgi:hypothetical protein